MAITPQLDEWLRGAGYQYHCFISWPHIKNPGFAECAQRIRAAIEHVLALTVPEPRVFLDEAEIPGGALWEQHLRIALCRSISMVAICAPIYFHPAHRWCGLEWAAMVSLGEQRLAGEAFRAIIPLTYRLTDPLPPAAKPIQYIDISRVSLRGSRYYTTNDFRIKIEQIVSRIENIAEAIGRRHAQPECEHFTTPIASAFDGYAPAVPAFPLRP